MNTSAKPAERVVIGISGTLASGKDTVAEQLVKDFGFTHISTSDMVREVSLKERNSIERPILYEVAEEQRRKYGAGIFVERALQKPGSLVITGLRTLGEAKAIKDSDGTLLFVDAPLELRYTRMKARVRDQESSLTLEGFKENERKEWHIGDSDTDFNLGGIKRIADIYIDSSEPREEFIKTAYKQLGLAHNQ